MTLVSFNNDIVLGPIINVTICDSTGNKCRQATLLIDTGASATCIKEEILNEMSLTPVGEESICTPSTQGAGKKCYTYEMNFVFHTHKGERLEGLKITGVPLGGQAIDGLLGRDIIDRGMLIYNGKENFYTLAF